jgi:hypothetical protein
VKIWLTTSTTAEAVAELLIFNEARGENAI